MQPVAVITGLRGQDASILAELLLKKDYKVYGLIRRSSSADLGCARELTRKFSQLEVIEGDLLDQSSLSNLCKKARPNYFYNLAAQSHVGTSFEQPNLTSLVSGIGVLNCLEAIRQSGIHTRFLQASTSEMYGGLTAEPASELTPFHPRSPYGVAKLYGYWMTVNYRESYKMFACSSICFNHEAPGKRGANFVTRKITLGLADILAHRKEKLFLGNLEAKRDWGYAEDFCEGMILILEAATPQDYVLATGETHSVREFCQLAFQHKGLDYKQYVEVDPAFYRPAEVNILIGDASKIKRDLGWQATTKFQDLVTQMVDYDCREVSSG